MAFPKSWRKLFGLKNDEAPNDIAVEIEVPTVKTKKQVVRRKRGQPHNTSNNNKLSE